MRPATFVNRVKNLKISKLLEKRYATYRCLSTRGPQTSKQQRVWPFSIKKVGDPCLMRSMGTRVLKKRPYIMKLEASNDQSSPLILLHLRIKPTHVHQ
jgi:hypothetical protein